MEYFSFFCTFPLPCFSTLCLLLKSDTEESWIKSHTQKCFQRVLSSFSFLAFSFSRKKKWHPVRRLRKLGTGTRRGKLKQPTMKKVESMAWSTKMTTNSPSALLIDRDLLGLQLTPLRESFIFKWSQNTKLYIHIKYSRLARHSLCAEANNAIPCNTVQWSWIT